MDTKKIEKIIKNIKEGKDDYFSYGHFHSSNISDYDLMRYTIEDMVYTYGINEFEAIEVIEALTHD